MVRRLGEQQLLRRVLLEEGFHPIIGEIDDWRPIGVGGNTRFDRSEVYAAHDRRRTGQPAIVKAKANGSAGEIPLLQVIAEKQLEEQGRSVFSIPYGVVESAVEVNSIEQPVVLLPRRYQEKETLFTVEQIDPKVVREQFMHLARGLQVLEEEQTALVDINPRNILVEQGGGGMQFMDGDASQTYDDNTRLEKVVNGFTHPAYLRGKPIDAGVDAFNFLATMTWVYGEHRMLLESPARELLRFEQECRETGRTPSGIEEILEILERPGVVRRRNTRVLVYVAAGLVAFGASEHSISQASTLVEQTPQVLMQEADALSDEQLRERLLHMRARDVQTLIEEGRYPITSTLPSDVITTLPVGYTLSGGPNDVPIQYQVGNTFIELLGGLSTAAPALEPFFEKLAYTQLLTAQGRPMDHFFAGFTDVRGLWLAYEWFGDEQFLGEIVTRTEQELAMSRETPDQHLLLSYRRSFETEAIIDDARIMRTLITGIDAAKEINDAEKVRTFTHSAQRFAQTLEQFIQQDTVYHAIVFDDERMRLAGPASTKGQAEVALAYAELGVRTREERLLRRSVSLLTPFFDMSIPRIGLRPEEHPEDEALKKPSLDDLATAYRAARVLEVSGFEKEGFASPILRRLVQYIAPHNVRVLFDDGFDYTKPIPIVQTSPAQQALFGGGLSCNDPYITQNAEANCRINTPFAEMEVIAGIAAPLPKTYQLFPHGSPLGGGGGQGGKSGPPQSQGPSAATAGITVTDTAAPSANTIIPNISIATTLFMISPQYSLRVGDVSMARRRWDNKYMWDVRK